MYKSKSFYKSFCTNVQKLLNNDTNLEDKKNFGNRDSKNGMGALDAQRTMYQAGLISKCDKIRSCKRKILMLRGKKKPTKIA